MYFKMFHMLNYNRNNFVFIDKYIVKYLFKYSLNINI